MHSFERRKFVVDPCYSQVSEKVQNIRFLASKLQCRKSCTTGHRKLNLKEIMVDFPMTFEANFHLAAGG